jgi:diguanylate cyclase (GGDEF)-like protein
MKNILLVDDSEIVLITIEKKLRQQLQEINILTAKTYKEAIKFILDKSIHIDVAIVDLNLPDVNDGAVANFTLKKGIPTIILTMLDDEKVEKFLAKEDFLEYIKKSDLRGYDIAVNTTVRIIKNSLTHILVVDDSPLQLTNAVQLLEKLKFQVTTARDGQEALEIIEKKDKKFSLVLTDYNMPIMNGMELTVHLREIYNKDELGIIVLSINDTPEIPTKFLKLGANDFINKPFTQLEVSTRINANLETLELFEKIKNLANKDFLTGAFNRRYFYDAAEAIFHKAKRKGESITVAMFDIDKFKNINDTYGHNIGDVALQESSKILKHSIRKSDLLARFGGEEFCFLLEDISQAETIKLFETIRKKFQDNILHVDGFEIKFTVSIGICYGLESSIDEMIKIADNGLYFCKENGRNQVFVKAT